MVIIITFLLMNKTEKSISLSNQPSDSACSNEVSEKRDDENHNCAWNSLCWTASIILSCLFISLCINILDFSTEEAAIRSWHIIISLLSTLITLGIFLVLANDYLKHRYAWSKGWRTHIIPAICLVGGVLYICTENATILPCFALIVLMYVCYIKTATNQKQPQIIESNTDLLYRSRLFNRTHLQIRKLAYDNTKGLTIGICGQWGSGKTFFINNLLANLSQQSTKSSKNGPLWEKPFVVCEKVELWSASSLDDAWERVIFALHKGIFDKEPLNIRWLSRLLTYLFSFIIPSHEAAHELISLVLPDFHNDQLRLLKERMHERKIVLVFDDLERADFSIIQAMLPLFERLKKLPNLIVICAVAEDELRRVFEHNKHDPFFSDGHLSKLFDLRVNVPSLNYQASQKMQNSILLRRHNNCHLLKSFLEEYPIRFDSPRLIIQTLEKLASIESQHFSGCNYSFHYTGDDKDVKNALTRIKYIFIVESLRVVSSQVLSILNNKKKLGQFLKDIPHSIIPEHTFYINEAKVDLYGLNWSDKTDSQEWINNNSELYEFIKTKGQVWSILTHMRKDIDFSYTSKEIIFSAKKEFDEALNGNYTRYTVLEKWELLDLLYRAECRNLSFTDRVKFHISSNKEDADSFHIAECSVLLLKQAFNKTITGEISISQFEEAITKEVELGENSAVKNYPGLSYSDYEHYLLSIYENQDSSTECLNGYEAVFFCIFELLSANEKGNLLQLLLLQLDNRLIYDEVHKSNVIINQICKTSIFQEIIKKHCEQFGYTLCQTIMSFPQGFTEYTTNYSIHPYCNFSNDVYLKKFEQGITNFFASCNYALTFIKKWVEFLGVYYRNTLFADVVYSTNATPSICRVMMFILEQIKLQPIYNNLSKEDNHYIRQILVNTKIKLEKDLQSWQERNYKYTQQYIKGIEGLIKIVDETLTLFK